MTATDGHSCCAPARAGRAKSAAGPASAEAAAPRRGSDPRKRMVSLDAATFRMGTDDATRFPGDGEGPSHEVAVDAFWMATEAVTNANFAAFIKATGHLTDAERYGWSFVFRGFVTPGAETISGEQNPGIPPWWAAVRGASWKHPEGPGSTMADRQNHPVTHVSWNDAVAYGDWAETRLPTEAEWEYAARGGLESARYPWGDELTPRGRWRCNIWQGPFPTTNTRDDGYAGTAPVNAFAPNGHGLHNVAGNVWEWCEDLFDEPQRDILGGELPAAVPQRPGQRVMRGGSYLCHDSYCNRYRVAARTSNPADTSAGNLGFRCAADPRR